MSGKCEKCSEHCLDCECNSNGTCELVIYCYECKKTWQLSSEMIALALATRANLWEVYEYILKYKCKHCKGKEE